MKLLHASGIRFFLLIIVFLTVSPLASATVLRVASWNIRNYTSTDRYLGKEEGWNPDYPKPEAEKDALRTVMLAVRPDIIVFQEMGPEGYLEELRLDLARAGLDYPYSAYMVAGDPERCLAALSNVPFCEVRREGDLSFTVAGESYCVKRGLLALVFETNGLRWTLYDAHLKSRISKAAEEGLNNRIRAGEATAVRNRIQKEQGADSFWMLAGDMNDTPSSSVWNRLTKKSGNELGIDLKPADSHSEYWTYYYNKKDSYERIDLLMASLPMMGAGIIPENAKIYDGSDASQASDHRMVYVDLFFSDGNE